MKTKYIVVKLCGFDFPFVFSEFCQHSDIARAIGGTVVGAGFCDVVDDRYICYGESISCNVKSRGEKDEQVLNHHLRG